MVRRKVTISLEPELVQKIDEDRGLIPRSAYIEKLLKETTEDKPPKAVPSSPRPLLPPPNPPHPLPARPNQTSSDL